MFEVNDTAHVWTYNTEVTVTVESQDLEGITHTYSDKYTFTVTVQSVASKSITGYDTVIVIAGQPIELTLTQNEGTNIQS